jgi:hypothetical protein
MSGPITAGYFLAAGTLAIVAEALRQARAMQRDYADVLAQLQERERNLAAARTQHRAARLERVAAMHTQAAQQQARDTQLRELAQALGADVSAVPAAPPLPARDADDVAWSAHLRAVADVIAALEQALGKVAAASHANLRTVIAGLGNRKRAASIDEVLASYVLQRQARAGLSAADAEEFRTTASRVLARLQLQEGAVLPPPLQALARDIVLAPSLERAEALATELRRAVQLARAEREQQVKDTAQARALLAQLSDNAPPELVAALERVAAGVELLDGPLREATQHLLDTAAAQREQDEQAAAALVLQESLRDLGYQVDDIESTLFADGGSVHFRREGWDQYFVKLRVAPAEHTVNFNVVRARGAEENSERKRQDALAEDRWCSEFPKLLETLKARGLELAVTRRLGAGEVPVQTVDPASLPAVAMQDDDTPGAPVLRQRPLS